MCQVEFFEGLARLADILSPVPYSFKNNDGDWPYEKNVNLDIWIKLESFLALIY